MTKTMPKTSKTAKPVLTYNGPMSRCAAGWRCARAEIFIRFSLLQPCAKIRKEAAPAASFPAVCRVYSSGMVTRSWNSVRISSRIV